MNAWIGPWGCTSACCPETHEARAIVGGRQILPECAPVGGEERTLLLRRRWTPRWDGYVVRGRDPLDPGAEWSEDLLADEDLTDLDEAKQRLAEEAGR